MLINEEHLKEKEGGLGFKGRNVDKGHLRVLWESGEGRRWVSSKEKWHRVLSQNMRQQVGCVTDHFVSLRGNFFLEAQGSD